MTDKNRAGRINLLNEMAELNGSAWARSDNPVKRRIGRLEVAWREGLQWLMEDIKKMFDNFVTISDGVDIIDVNLATVKSLCVQKGIFTEEEFKARQTAIFGMLDRAREKKQAELEALQAAEKERSEKASEKVADPNVVDPALVKMRDRAAATTDDDHVPRHATVFGG